MPAVKILTTLPFVTITYPLEWTSSDHAEALRALGAVLAKSQAAVLCDCRHARPPTALERKALTDLIEKHKASFLGLAWVTDSVIARHIMGIVMWAFPQAFPAAPFTDPLEARLYLEQCLSGQQRRAS